MDKSTCSDQVNCRKAAQYVLTIVIVLVVGAIVSSLPIMTNVPVERGLFVADIVAFAAKLAALILFYLCARHAIAALPDNGGVLSFVRGIAVPATALIIIVLGQRLVWHIIAPFIDATGETFYFSVALLAIVAAAIWFMLSAYRNSPYIIDGLQRFAGNSSGFWLQKKTRVCPDCAKTNSVDAKFCQHCGQQIVAHNHQCTHCAAPIIAEQKYCSQCGEPANYQSTDEPFDL